MAEESNFNIDDLSDLGGPAVEDSSELPDSSDSPPDGPEPGQGEVALEEVASSGELAQEVPPSQDKSRSDEFDYSTPLNPREQQLLERLEQITGEKLELTSQPSKDETQPQFTPQEINFLEGLDLDEVFSSPENFNKLLLTVYNKGLETASQLALENTYRNLPATISQYVTQHMETKAMVDAFYASNPDLGNVKRTVAAVANEISAQHPEYTLQQVFDDAATKTRQILNIKAQQAKTPKGAPRRTPALPGQNSNNGRQSRYVESGLDGLAKEVHDLLVEL